MTKPMTGRELALQALIRFRRDGAWPDLFLKKEGSGLPPEEMALAAALVYGVLENRSLIDFYLASYSKLPLKKVMPQVLDSMRLAVYQLVFLEKIPQSAAVNECVKQVKKMANPRAASYCNGVLRSLSRSLQALPQPQFPTKAETLSVQYSHPLWLVKQLIAQEGETQCEAFLQANNAKPQAVLRVNTLKTTAEALLVCLPGTKPHPYLPDALICEQMGAALKSEAFQKGWFSVQDSASQLCVRTLDPKPGETVVDLCAAPGGKSILAAQYMQAKGTLRSFDLHLHKVSLIQDQAERVGAFNLTAEVSDGTRLRPELTNYADAIICDVPCSGIGIIRKKPDIRYKNPQDLASLPETQSKILKNALCYLKPGGRLIYSTCTVLNSENQAVVESALQEHPECALESFTLPGIGPCPSGMITLWPQVHGTDGFFLAKIRKL